MKDKDIFDFVKNEAEKSEIPDSLKPCNMINMLGEQLEEEKYLSVDVMEANRDLVLQKNKKKAGIKKVTVMVAGIAAALLLVIFGKTALDGLKITDNDTTNDKKKENEPVVSDVVSEEFLNFQSYAQLKEYIEKVGLEDDFWIYESEDITMAITDSAAGTSPEGTNSGEMNTDDMTPEYSDTTTRTEGVLEADCVKTDGEYIYYISGVESKVVLNIIKADGENTEYVGEYNISDIISEKYYNTQNEINAKEMLVYGDKLIILGTIYSTDADENTEVKTIVSVWDITDITAVSHKQSFTVDGNYEQCRMNDGYLYVLSNSEIDMEKTAPEVEEEYIECEDIYVCDCNYYNTYSIFTTYNMKEEPQLVSDLAVVNNNTVDLYVTTNSIYLMSTESRLDDGNKMYQSYISIMKYSYSEGNITPVAATEVKGWLNDIFCVDEYNDYLRLVVTSYTDEYEQINSLYVLDNELQISGKIEDIAPGERIYSARFDGDIGYFVTFLQVDPLFSVDLSDPTNPKIMGELKIPGFSEFMFMWEDGKMLGIGEEDRNIKLSMFDISDPFNVTEEDKLIVENAYYSEALYNYKSLLVNSDKNLIGFLASGMVMLETSIYEEYEDIINIKYKEVVKYYLYAYEEENFIKKAEIVFDYFGFGDVRGMYIGDYIYIVSTGGSVNVISMDSYECIKTVQHN